MANGVDGGPRDTPRMHESVGSWERQVWAATWAAVWADATQLQSMNHTEAPSTALDWMDCLLVCLPACSPHLVLPPDIHRTLSHPPILPLDLTCHPQQAALLAHTLQLTSAHPHAHHTTRTPAPSASCRYRPWPNNKQSTFPTSLRLIHDRIAFHKQHPSASPTMTSATMVEVKPPAHAKPGTSPHPHPHSHSPGPPPPQHHPQQPLPTAPVPPRVHTLDLKAKLAAALGTNGKRYWDALLRFSTAKISRDEFEDEARSCLRSEHGEQSRRVSIHDVSRTNQRSHTRIHAIHPHPRPSPHCQSTCTTLWSLASYTTPHPPCPAPLRHPHWATLAHPPRTPAPIRMATRSRVPMAAAARAPTMPTVMSTPPFRCIRASVSASSPPRWPPTSGSASRPVASPSHATWPTVPAPAPGLAQALISSSGNAKRRRRGTRSRRRRDSGRRIHTSEAQTGQGRSSQRRPPGKRIGQSSQLVCVAAAAAAAADGGCQCGWQRAAFSSFTACSSLPSAASPLSPLRARPRPHLPRHSNTASAASLQQGANVHRGKASSRCRCTR